MQLDYFISISKNFKCGIKARSCLRITRNRGNIGFNGSVHNYLGQPGGAAYAAGLVSIARSIAADLAPRKIRVNVVAPGATKTPIWKRGVRANATAEESAKGSDFFSSTVPLARSGEPEDLAKAVLFLPRTIRRTSTRSS
jgi:NAD(P)-dependent dehydrogenase (short-subunit alcohol dehydrogenase family)